MLIQSYVYYFEEKFVSSCAATSASSTYNHNDTRFSPSPPFPGCLPENEIFDQMNQFYFKLPIKLLINDIDSISEQNSPENFTFKRLDNNTQLFRLKGSEETGILAVHECISADRNLHLRLSYHGLVIPLLQWFRYEINCTSAVPLLNLECLKTLSPI